jgi:hypothetical protein
MTISEADLTAYSFSEKDAVFVTDSVQVEFLKSAANASLSRSRLLPLSVQAYGAILRIGHASSNPISNPSTFLNASAGTARQR